MSQPAKKLKQRFTYGDYLTWPEDERWELIDGVAYNMTPAPSRRHQEISVNLVTAIRNFLQGHQCKVYNAPFDVRLPAGDEDDVDIETVIQPDIVVVCDKSKLDDRGCKGAPDLVIEIISPYTLKKDLVIKKSLYEKAGVTEYWVVFPLEKGVQVYHLGAEGKYDDPVIYEEDDEAPVLVLEGLSIKLSDVFAE